MVTHVHATEQGPLDPKTIRLQSNLNRVRDRVATACERAGRSPNEVVLVGVTKYVSAADTARLLDCGVVDLGESRPQLLWEKAATLANLGLHARWHMIGHLQRNKLRKTLPLVSLVHSLDSLRLAEAISEEAAKIGQPCQALIEVNLTGDHGRSGVSFHALQELADYVAASDWIQLRGLMGMAEKPEANDNSPRKQFARLREARDQLQPFFAHEACSAGQAPPGELSIGMSGDFEDAILEGATLIRIGSVLWEGLDDD
ncbi:MAG: YggS family pyridoxal phosphate-dependent enzyme [Pirellulales bacterium]|jgi:pyridoxal phosphate enzyme (YggS family)